MEAAQEWCLQCGTPVPGSLSTHAPSWRSSAIVLAACAILAVGAATAAYAALTKTKAKPRQVVVAQVPAATTPVAPTTVPPSAIPAPPSVATTPTPAPPAVKPPKIPLVAPAPKPTATAPKTTPTPTTPKAKTPQKTATTPTSSEQPPATTAILLDTNAITNYNPENYPPDTFGDPSLATDGDTSTAWSARVDPTIAPRMAVGLLIDLKTPQKLSSLELITSTPGITVQVFGANGSAAPTTITNPAWTHLSPAQLEKKKHTLVKLSNSTKAFRFVTLWISGAPPASIGTPTAPGRVSVNEVEVFPTK